MKRLSQTINRTTFLASAALFLFAAASRAQVTIPASDILSEQQVQNFQQKGLWLGPQWWANRLQDWSRISKQGAEGNIIQCSPNAPFLKWRVAHDMVHPLDLSAKGHLSAAVTVSLRSDNVNKSLAPDSLAGLLVGTGNTAENLMSRMLIFEFSNRKKSKLPYAAVPGSGIAVGISGDQHLRIIDLDIGKMLVEAKLTEAASHSLKITSQNNGDLIELIVQSGAATVRASFPRDRFRGGIALTSHPGKRSPKHGSLISTFAHYQVSSGVSTDNSQSIGPIVAAQYTVDTGILKLTAQCMPQAKGSVATLSFLRKGKWVKSATAPIHPIDQLALFRIEKWDSSTVVAYRVSIPLAGTTNPAIFTGKITAQPTTGKLRLACLGGIKHRPSWGPATNWQKELDFPHHDLTKQILDSKPDTAFFYGDQIYESCPSGVDRNDYFNDYLYKWTLHCIAFRELLRNIPTITVPDDHDVFQGNYWGEGGRKAPHNDWNFGGYRHPGEFVAQVHRTQTGHLPDPADPHCLKQNLPAYHCDWNWGGVSFAILGDRYFKSGPAGHGLPESGTKRPDHYNNPKFDTKELDLPGLELLGKPQEKFLADWAQDWTQGAQVKVLLSQSPFANTATHHAGRFLIADLDSNGWPQSGRNRALRLLRSARACHLTGDQHLATLLQHGIDQHSDAIYSFAAPSVANAYARAFYPGYTGNYYRTTPPKPEQYLGDRLDGFQNKITFHGVANPDTSPTSPYTSSHTRRDQQVPGYGIIDFDIRKHTITFDCKPRAEEISKKLKGGSYPGWPLTITASQNDGRKPIGELARISVTGKNLPAVRVYGPDGKLEWAQRMDSMSFTVPAYKKGIHTLQIGSGDGESSWQTFKKLIPKPTAAELKITLQ